jgi:tetratricopeptide (TPR) repeat protein
MKLRTLLQILVLLALPKAKGANDGPRRTGDDLFAKADTEFAAGNFKAAIADYQAVVGSREWSANLFYDLGNAYFRHGDFGRAILNYDRALRLDPRHPEADANLRIAHDQAHSLELTPPALERYLNFGTANFFAIVAAIFFWLAIIWLILRPGRVLWAIAGMFLAAICGFAAFRLENGTRGQNLAIVIAENAEARVATVDSARSVLALPAGSEVLILQERGDWNYAALPNDQRGWIAANAVEKVRL